MVSIAGKNGCTAQTLRRWCRDEAVRRAGPAALADDDRARLKLFKPEVRELRRANEILRTASACLVMAEIDRHDASRRQPPGDLQQRLARVHRPVTDTAPVGEHCDDIGTVLDHAFQRVAQL